MEFITLLQAAIAAGLLIFVILGMLFFFTVPMITMFTFRKRLNRTQISDEPPIANTTELINELNKCVVKIYLIIVPSTILVVFLLPSIPYLATVLWLFSIFIVIPVATTKSYLSRIEKLATNENFKFVEIDVKSELIKSLILSNSIVISIVLLLWLLNSTMVFI